MSIDAYLVIDTGGSELAYVTDGRNHTHNTSGMWTKAMEHANARSVRRGYEFLVPYGWTFYQFLEGGITYLSDPDKPRMPGKLGHSFKTNLPVNPPTGIQASRVIKEMIFEMEAQPEFFRTMNPENGWGSYDTALQFLRDFLVDCEAHPRASVVVSL